MGDLEAEVMNRKQRRRDVLTFRSQSSIVSKALVLVSVLIMVANGSATDSQSEVPTDKQNKNNKNDNKDNDKQNRNDAVNGNSGGFQWARPYEIIGPTTKPTSPPTPLPSRAPVTPEPSNPPSKPPTLAPTTKVPSAAPTMPPTTSSPTTSNPTTSHPTISSPTTPNPTLTPTLAYWKMKSPESNVLQYEDLETIQVVPANSPLFNVSLAFNLWFPDRVGVTGAEDSQATHVQTSIITTLQYLFCDTDKGNFHSALGLQDFTQYNLCVFTENVVRGDSATALSLGGVRRLKKKDIVLQEAYEKGKWDDADYEDLDKSFAAWQSDRSDSGVAIYPIDFMTNGNGNENNEETGESDDDSAVNDDGIMQELVLDMSVLLDPPHLHPHIHFNAHKNLAWTTWNVTWPVVRLSMEYLKQAWELRSGSGNVNDDDIFALGVQLMQEDMASYLNENLGIKVMDVMLESVLKEPVRASAIGQALSQSTNNDHSTEASSSDPEIAEDDDYHHDYTTVDEATEPALNPHLCHALRVVGITMLFFTFKLIFALNYLSRRRKNAREAEQKRLTVGRGLLHSPEGVDEMLLKTISAPRAFFESTKTRLEDITSSRTESEVQSEQDYQTRRPMPIDLSGY